MKWIDSFREKKSLSALRLPLSQLTAGIIWFNLHEYLPIETLPSEYSGMSQWKIVGFPAGSQNVAYFRQW